MSMGSAPQQHVEVKIKEDSAIIKSTKVYMKGPLPYRYVLCHSPKRFPQFPYSAYRENMVLVNGIWESDIKYWCSYNSTLDAAEKEYQKRIDSEGVMT